MQDSELEKLYANKRFQKFAQDPDWFKKAMGKTLFYAGNDELSHPYYLNSSDSSCVIITTLRHIRAVTPSSKNPVDDEFIHKTTHLDGNSCVALLIDGDGDDLLVEPLTTTRVIASRLRGYSAEDKSEYMKNNGAYFILDHSEYIPPFCYATKELLDRWGNETVPYANELKSYLEELKRETDRNFGCTGVTVEDVSNILVHKKTQ